MMKYILTVGAIILFLLWGRYIFTSGDILGLFFISGFILLGSWAFFFYEKNPRKEKTTHYYICVYFTKRGERLRIFENPIGRVVGQYHVKKTDYLDVVNTMKNLSMQLHIPVFREEDDFLNQ